MKKSIKNIAAAFFLALFTLGFVSCGYEPVFFGIMHDVEQEEATVTGNITSIARCTLQINGVGTECLILSNGGSIKYKPVTSSRHGEWTSSGIKVPFEYHHYDFFSSQGHYGQQVLNLLADENNIYLLTASSKEDSEYGVVMADEFFLWTCPLNKLLSGSPVWKNLNTEYPSLNLLPKSRVSSSSTPLLDAFLFSTNAINAEHREVFIRVADKSKTPVEYKYYKLDGASNPVPVTPNDSNTVKVGTSEIINSAFYCDGIKFSNSFSVTTNKTETVAYLAGVSSGNYPTGDLYSYIPSPSDGSEPLEKALRVDSSITSLAATANSVLIGKGSYLTSYTAAGGIDRVLLDGEGRPETSLAAFTNNAKYQFTSSYILMTLLCADPDEPEDQACLYTSITFRGSGSSSSASFGDIGLWSYYPGRGNWNRE